MNVAMEFALAVLLATGAVWFTLRPILRPSTAGPGGGGARNGATGEGEETDEDMSPRAVAVRALKEIEFDRATGKLADADYEALKARYTGEALAALRAEAGARGGPAPAAQRAPAVAGPPHAPVHSCPTHGRRPEPGAEFCSECGRRLGSAPGYCARCGTSLAVDASYCNACGARVAA